VQQEFDRRIERQLTCPWNRGWPAEQPPHPCSRQANALGVLLGLGTARQQARASDFVARSMTPEEITRNPLSHLWINKVLGAMFLTGHDREAVQVLRSSYGAWAAKGATTWSELWDADATTHAQTYGGAVNWVLTAYLLGVRPSKPGFAEVIFDPRPGDLEQVEGTVPTPKGDIHVSWKQVRPGMLESEIRGPRNVNIIRNKEFS